MRVANKVFVKWSRVALVSVVLMAGIFFVSCTGRAPEPEETLQFSLPVVEEEPTRAVSQTPETVLPTMSQDDISVAITPEAEVIAVSEETGEVEPGNQTPSVLPEEFYIRNITGRKQYYPLGCETSTAVDLANYFGVAILESDFQNRLPLSDNPDFGFVGSVEGPWGQVPPYAYGVHAGPVGDLLQEYGLNAVGEKQFTIERIKSEIASGQPVIAWVIGNVVGGIPHEYEDSQGRKVIVAAYEHVVIVTGYSDVAGTLRYMNNGKFYDVPVEHFDGSWAVLERMVVYIAD